MDLRFDNYAKETLTVLQGKALEQKYPVKINIIGNIKAISSFMGKRYGTLKGKGLQEVDASLAVVLVDETAMSIILKLDPQNEFGTEVKGFLELTDELKGFSINEGQQFSREELVQKIRFNRRFFSQDKHVAILAAYMKLSLTGQTTLSAASDTRGNRELAYRKEINSQNIPTEFVLTLPIFKGFTPETFRVEVCLEATDASVRFWFESVELAELIERRKLEIINEELKSVSDFVIISK
jgi:hypothetical protein